MELFVELNGTRTPIRREDLFRMAGSGELSPDSKLWYDGRETTCGHVRGLQFGAADPSSLEIQEEGGPGTTASEAGTPKTDAGERVGEPVSPTGATVAQPVTPTPVQTAPVTPVINPAPAPVQVQPLPGTGPIQINPAPSAPVRIDPFVSAPVHVNPVSVPSTAAPAVPVGPGIPTPVPTTPFGLSGSQPTPQPGPMPGQQPFQQPFQPSPQPFQQPIQQQFQQPGPQPFQQPIQQSMPQSFQQPFQQPFQLGPQQGPQPVPQQGTRQGTPNTPSGTASSSSEAKERFHTNYFDFVILGGSLPVIICYLVPGQEVVSSAGGRVWMKGAITTENMTEGGALGTLGRMLSGETLLMSHYRAAGQGEVAFASKFPGTIIAKELQYGESIICQKGAFLASSPAVKLETYLQKQIGAGFFGGEGFVMQKMTGPGVVFLELDGHCVEYNLGYGEQLTCDTGCVALMDATCSLDIVMIKGLKNIFLGGEGLFDTVITGPGKVTVQSMTMSALAGIISPLIKK